MAVIELPDSAARAAYLDRACGADTALRGRVEALLRSHEVAGNFLGTPFIAPPGSDPASNRAFTHDPDPTGATYARTAADDVLLTFLAPQGRPDSLDRIGHYEDLQVLEKGGLRDRLSGVRRTAPPDRR